MMKKAYKYLILLTIGVIGLSVLILFMSGRTSQLINTPLFLSQYVLFNIYMFLVAYFYSPMMESLPQIRSGSRTNLEMAMTSITELFDRKAATHKNDNKHTHDRSSIMSKFYEQEMPELTKANVVDHKAFDQSFEDEDDLETFNSSQASKSHRRDLKKSNQDKAKERLWQEIEQEVSSQADSSDEDSDEEHQI
jgi:hypothetical protein